jgi:hypothetical protein
MKLARSGPTSPERVPAAATETAPDGGEIIKAWESSPTTIPIVRRASFG